MQIIITKSGKTDPNIHGHDLYEQYRDHYQKSVSVPNYFVLTVKVILEAVCVKLIDENMFP